MNKSIFKNTGTDLKKLFKETNPYEILYVSIDVAKYNHSFIIANFFGDIIVPMSDFPYNKHGIDFLRKKVDMAQKQTKAKKIFFGLESTGHYHENLTAALMELGYDIAVINPTDSKNERDNVHAKTDNVDLGAIARVIMSNKGKRSYIPDTIYYNLRRASRTHRQFTHQETSIKNVITMLVDKTFNGLWNPENHIFSEKWSKGSLLFVENYTAEVGDIHRFAYAGQVVSLAGTAPQKHQSGKLNKDNLKTSRKGRNLLRMTVNQIALSLDNHCPEYHNYYFSKLSQYQDTPGKAKTATANRFIKLAFSMMRKETLYCPRAYDSIFSQKEHQVYYQGVWNKMKETLTPYLCHDIPPDNYLVKIHNQLEETYGITP